MDNKEQNEDLGFTQNGSFKIEFLSKDGDVLSSTEDTDLKPIVNAEPKTKSERLKPAAQDFEWPDVSPLSPEPEKFKSRPSVYAQRASEGKKITAPLNKPAVSAPSSKPHSVEKPRSEKRTIPEEAPPIDPKAEKDFEVDFDYDEEYGSVDEKIVQRGSGKRTGCISGILYFIFVVCISVVLASFGWLWVQDMLGLGEDGSEVNITVPKTAISSVERTEENDDGEKVTKTVSVADIDTIADLLYDNGLVKYKWLFKLFCSFSNAEEKVKAGSYILKTDYDYRALIYGMNPSAGKRVEVDITIPEGFTVRQIVALLDEKGVCDANEMWDALRNGEYNYEFVSAETPRADNALEGYLFPDTYTFYLGDTPTRVIGKLLNNFNKKWTAEFTERANELGYTQREILTIASMIEKEAGGDSERAAIASVIYNRLRDGGNGTNFYLQLDATLYYAAAETGAEVSVDMDSPYNTYRNPGLTPGPIANPGLASIKAALNPESTNYYYYALGKDHLHRFFRTLDEHTAFVHSSEYGG